VTAILRQLSREASLYHLARLGAMAKSHYIKSFHGQEDYLWAYSRVWV